MSSDENNSDVDIIYSSDDEKEHHLEKEKKDENDFVDKVDLSLKNLIDSTINTPLETKTYSLIFSEFYNFIVSGGLIKD